MRTRTGIAIACLLSVVATSALWSFQDATRAEAQSSASLDGTYVRSARSSATEDAARGLAITRATASLPARSRNLWRGLLEEMVLPAERVQLARQGADLVVHNGERVELRSAATGAARQIEGGWKLDQRIEGSTLVQRIESSEVAGERLAQPLRQTLRYSLSSDQQRLTIETRIEGGELPTAIVFSVTYQRS